MTASEAAGRPCTNTRLSNDWSPGKPGKSATIKIIGYVYRTSALIIIVVAAESAVESNKKEIAVIFAAFGYVVIED